MIIIAHRGANKEAPENTHEAFLAAIEAGAQRIELDVHLSADDQLVIYHDFFIPMANKKIPISELNYSQMPSSIPLLGDCLERYLDIVEFNIEIKPSCNRLNSKLQNLLSGIQAKDKIIISCFKEDPLLYFRDHLPSIARACLWDTSTVLQWPSEFSNFAPQIFMNKVKTNIFHPRANLVSQTIMDYAHTHNWIVYPWFGMKDEDLPNKSALWDDLYGLGVHGICTNYPRQMKFWLDEIITNQNELSEIRTTISQLKNDLRT